MNVRVLRHALLASVVLVIGPTLVAVWAARTLTAENPPKWVTDQQALKDAVKHDNALIAQDSLKPKARGEFGPFLAVGPEDTSDPASREQCDVETSYGGDGGNSLPLSEILSSPLAIPELSTDMASACDGVVRMVDGMWLMPNEYGGDEAVDVMIFMLGYLPFRAEWQVAADRTEFGKIAGYPALIEHPIPGQVTNKTRDAYILFAEPKGDTPGIIVRVSAPSVERASEVVLASLEKRIAAMGLPPNPFN